MFQSRAASGCVLQPRRLSRSGALPHDADGDGMFSRWIQSCNGATCTTTSIRFAQMDSMRVGDMTSDAQLSLQLLVVGVGCLLGPIVFMSVIPTTVTFMTFAVAACFVLFAASTSYVVPVAIPLGILCVPTPGHKRRLCPPGGLSGAAGAFGVGVCAQRGEQCDMGVCRAAAAVYSAQ